MFDSAATLDLDNFIYFSFLAFLKLKAKTIHANSVC